jgi:site-specific DNA-methyltransferase (adenine-specific)
LKPYYESGGITIYHGDCFDVLPKLRPEVIVTDPPYGMKKADWDMKIPDWLSMVPGIPTALFCGVIGMRDYPPPQWVGAWVRQGSTQRIGALKGFNNWEPILFYNLANLGNDVIVEPNFHPDYGHPTVKPYKVIGKLVSLMPKGLLVDPFMGSGTTLRVAKDAGLRAIGIEIEERYCEIAVKRLAQEVLFGTG